MGAQWCALHFLESLKLTIESKWYCRLMKESLPSCTGQSKTARCLRGIEGGYKLQCALFFRVGYTLSSGSRTYNKAIQTAASFSWPTLKSRCLVQALSYRRKSIIETQSRRDRWMLENAVGGLSGWINHELHQPPPSAHHYSACHTL